MTNHGSISSLIVVSTFVTTAACAFESTSDSDIEQNPLSGSHATIATWRGTPRPEIVQVLNEHPDGVQISQDQIAWNNGKIILTVPSEPQSSIQGANDLSPLASVDGCPSGWYCFYQDINFNAGTSGRRLQFQDCGTGASGGLLQKLSDYGFANQTSSWVVNRSLSVVDVFDSGGAPLWPEHGNSKSSYVGDGLNDMADAFICIL